MTPRQLNYFLLALFAASLLVWVPNSLARRSTALEQIGLLVDLRHEIVQRYVTEPNEEEMMLAAVRGMIESLNDPYTSYLTPDDIAQFERQVRGSFSGIGAEVMLDEGLNRLKIVTPLEDSPAWKAGVLAGDIVLEIDGKTTEGMKLTNAVERLTGPEGTQVTVLVRHQSGEEQTIVITRARINVQTVRGLRRTADHHWDWLIDRGRGIGYVRLTQFTERSTEDLKDVITKMKADGLKGLILDMRFNPGGLLEAAVAVSDMFLPEGETIVSVRGRKVEEHIQKATKAGTIFEGPVVVLVNEASASASEIVAGALRDHNRAHVVGTRTFGKGSVQQVRGLPSAQGAIKMTNAYYYIPSGAMIHRLPDAERWGVDPSDGAYVPMSPKEIRRLLEVRRDGDVVRKEEPKNGPEAVTPAFIQEKLADKQLAAGLTALLGFLDKQEWPVVGESDPNAMARATQREALVRQKELIAERIAKIDEEIAKIDAGGAINGESGALSVDGSDEP